MTPQPLLLRSDSSKGVIATTAAAAAEYSTETSSVAMGEERGARASQPQSGRVTGIAEIRGEKN